jgi:hypothetical protein
MNAIYYECVNERKKFQKKKVNQAQFKQITPKCGWQEGNLGPLDVQPSTLPFEPF